MSGNIVESPGPQPPIWLASDEVKAAAVERFKQIEDIETSKREIEAIVRTRLSLDEAAPLPPEEIDEKVRYVTNALNFSDEKHKKELRITGEQYIKHPLGVAFRIAIDNDILPADLPVAVATAANHDVLENSITSPSELRKAIGQEATAGVIVLSTKIKVFEDNPAFRRSELARLALNPDLTIDELILKRWFQRKGRTRIEKVIEKSKDVRESPDYIGRIAVYDREDNINTLPDPTLQYHPDVQQKVHGMWNNIFDETRRHIIPIATTLGLAEILRRSIWRAQQKKKPYQ